MTKFGKPWSIQDLENHMRKRPEQRVVSAKAVGGEQNTVKSSQVVANQTKSVVSNKKVRNATKIEHEGVKYDSKLEFYTASELKKAGIAYEFQKCYELQPGFIYRKAKIRPMTLTVDFWLPQFDMIVDSKGFRNDVSPVKYKLLKFLLKSPGQEPEIQIPKNRKQVDAMILSLLLRTDKA